MEPTISLLSSQKVTVREEGTATYRRTMKDYIGVALRGFCMGAADVVPGVSGGTMAFILGIYDELIHALHAINLTFFRRLFRLQWRAAFADLPWQFLLALGLGIGTAIFTLAEGLSWALHHHPELVRAFFFGLVLASAVTVRRRVRQWTAPMLILSLLATIGAYLLVGLTPAETPHTPVFLFFSGAIAICAMILPGISGAFILVLLGQYLYILDAVTRLDVFTLGIVASGAAVGLLSFVRLLRWLLMRSHDLVIAFLIGLMVGSLRKIWPWKALALPANPLTRSHHALLPTYDYNVLPAEFTPEVGLTIGLMGLGFGVVLVIEHLAARRRQVST